MSGFNYEEYEREVAEGRPALIQRVKSLLESANDVRSLSLSVVYRKGARQLMARHNITEEELRQ